MSSALQQFYPQSLCVECVLWGFGFAPPTVQENPIRFIEHSYLTMFVNVSVNGCVRKTFLLVILSVSTILLLCLDGCGYLGYMP